MRINLTELCKARGWSLTRLAKESGVPVQTLHGWVVGRRSIDVEQLRAVALALRVSLYSLCFGTSDPHTSGGEALTPLFSGDVRLIAYRIDRPARKGG